MELNQLEKIVEFCSGFENPVILFDKDWNIVYCNKKSFVNSKSSVQNITMSDIEKLKAGENILVVVKDMLP